ncbi:MAG: thiamine phosphate synthase [Hydrogenophaga sp.]|nr:thiamine phosphate synthase [Hydrogenophaga sp.]
MIVDSAAWIERLVPLGVKLVQLRIKDMPEAALRDEIRRARALCAGEGCQLIVNDYWRIAIDEGCDFVHLGQEDLADADVAAIRAAGMKLGISTHDEAELETALAAQPDYMALGPVYPTMLKQTKWAPQGLDRLSAWRERIAALPLVAIGGLTVERLEGVLAHGADSAVVVTDIVLHPSSQSRTREWIEKTAERRGDPADGGRVEI